MPLDRDEIEASLQKKGFNRREGDHSKFIYHTSGGQKTSVWTKTSHGSAYKTLGDKLVGAMAKQCGLTNQEFREFVDCSLTQKLFEEVLIGRGRIKVSK